MAALCGSRCDTWLALARPRKKSLRLKHSADFDVVTKL
jgi:hypothetical protein|tara:strand:- start:46 stop:159 length:114 start_codon:yes stop_codon:yes gene_type:complete